MARTITSLEDANTPLSGDELVELVQLGSSRKSRVSDLPQNAQAQMAASQAQSFADQAGQAADAAQASAQQAAESASEQETLRQDLAGPTGAALVGYGSSNVLAALDSMASPDAGYAATGPLRIVFHFNYENDKARLFRAREMGFNTLWIYNTAPWMNDQARTIAWLNLIESVGLRAILQVDYLHLSGANSGSPTPEATAAKNWVIAVQGHPAVIGFTAHDEPIGTSVDAAEQAATAAVIRSVTVKSIFTVHAAQGNKNAYYRSDVTDVFLLDIYLNQYMVETDFKLEHAQRILSFLAYNGNNSIANKRPPSSIIPVMASFAYGSEFPMPSINQARWAAEVWKAFCPGADYGFFAHDVPEALAPGYQTLDTSEFLRNMVKAIEGAWVPLLDPGFVLITPRGYTYHPAFLELNNAVYQALSGRPAFTPATSAAGSYSVAGKAKIRPGAKHLAIYGQVFNEQDGLTRTTYAEVNDGSGWQIVGSRPFGSATEEFVCQLFPVPAGMNSVAFRVRVDSGANNNPTNTTGIRAIAAVSI